MMEGHFAALSSKYDFYGILYCIITVSISFKSQIEMLSYNIKNIIVNREVFLLGVREIEKQVFNIYFLN